MIILYIVFNCLQTGLGNNGGTRTIINCQRVLERLGHRCDIVATVDKFTWFHHKKPIKTIPKDANWLIATSCTSVQSTIDFKSKIMPNKAWYIRAHETWNPKFPNDDKMGELYHKCKDAGMLMIVNSEWQKQNLEWMKIKSHIIYQGLDLPLWQNQGTRDTNKKVTIGCLYTPQPRKRWKDFVKIADQLGTDHYKWVAYGTTSPEDELDTFIEQPSATALCRLYSMCDIWFAPTDSEGLHNPPMEASLCGCLIVCSNNFRNGMSDYALHCTTALVYKDISEAIQYIKTFAKNKNNENYKQMILNSQNLIIDKIGSREKNMNKLVDLLVEHE